MQPSPSGLPARPPAGAITGLPFSTAMPFPGVPGPAVPATTLGPPWKSPHRPEGPSGRPRALLWLWGPRPAGGACPFGLSPGQVLWDLLGLENMCPKPIPKCPRYSSSQKGLAQPPLWGPFYREAASLDHGDFSPCWLGCRRSIWHSLFSLSEWKGHTRPQLCPRHPSPPSCARQAAGEPATAPCALASDAGWCPEGTDLQEHTVRVLPAPACCRRQGWLPVPSTAESPGAFHLPREQLHTLLPWVQHPLRSLRNPLRGFGLCRLLQQGCCGRALTLQPPPLPRRAPS